MASRKTKGAAPILTDAIRQQMAQQMQPIHRDEAPIYRGNERLPLIAVDAPGRGRLLAKGCDLVHDCCKARNMETDKPGALRILKTALPGYLSAEPVLKYDKFATDLFQLTWSADRSRADIDLLPILQPRNLEVPQGYVAEIPMSMENLNGKMYLVIYLDAAETRTIQELDEAQKAARKSRKAPGTEQGQNPQ